MKTERIVGEISVGLLISAEKMFSPDLWQREIREFSLRVSVQSLSEDSQIYLIICPSFHKQNTFLEVNLPEQLLGVSDMFASGLLNPK